MLYGASKGLTLITNSRLAVYIWEDLNILLYFQVCLNSRIYVQWCSLSYMPMPICLIVQWLTRMFQPQGLQCIVCTACWFQQLFLWIINSYVFFFNGGPWCIGNHWQQLEQWSGESVNCGFVNICEITLKGKIRSITLYFVPVSRVKDCISLVIWWRMAKCKSSLVISLPRKGVICGVILWMNCKDVLWRSRQSSNSVSIFLVFQACIFVWPCFGNLQNKGG